MKVILVTVLELGQPLKLAPSARRHRGRSGCDGVLEGQNMSSFISKVLVPNNRNVLTVVNQGIPNVFHMLILAV